MAESRTQARVFLSYNRTDAALADDLRKRLSGAGILTFFDREQLTLGRPWAEELELALRSARAVLVLVGGNELGDWQKREVWFALDLQAKNALRVIPVLLPGARTTTRFLFLNSWIDLRTPDACDGELMRLQRALSAAPDATDAELAPSLLAAPAECPYLGLRTFQEEDAGLFFGREALADRLLHAALNHSLVTVVGASGSGKSSVVRAGLVPRLRRRRQPDPTWDVAICTPGPRPWSSLAAALVALLEPHASPTQRIEATSRLGTTLRQDADALGTAIDLLLQQRKSCRLLLVIDQCEELFTQASDQEPARYLDVLLACRTGRPLTLLLTLRADYYAHAVGHGGLRDAMVQAQLNVGPLERAELVRAIREPARQAGLAFSESLVLRIVDDVARQPGALPLLEYALEAMWEKREGASISEAAYTAIGGLTAVITARAEATYAQLSVRDKELARDLFLRLVHVAPADAEGSDVRRRAQRGELSSEAWEIAARFADQPRLLTISRTLSDQPGSTAGVETVEVVHEALIKHWSRFQSWIAEHRDFLSWRQHLESEVRLWEQTRRSADALLTGAALGEARRWLRREPGKLTAAETAFIHSSARRARRTAFGPIALGGSLIALLGTLYGMTQTDRYQLESLLLQPLRLSADPATAAKMYGAFGRLGWVRTAGYLQHTSASRTAPTGWMRQVVDRAAAEASDPPRQLLLGLMQSGKFDEARSVVERSVRPGSDAAVCAHATLSTGFSALGRHGDARSEWQRAERLANNRASDVTGLCLMEASAWLQGDAQQARTSIRLWLDRHALERVPARWLLPSLFAVTRRHWFPEAKRLAQLVVQRMYSIENEMGVELALAAYVSSAPREDTEALGRDWADHGTLDAQALWTLALVHAGRDDLADLHSRALMQGSPARSLVIAAAIRRERPANLNAARPLFQTDEEAPEPAPSSLAATIERWRAGLHDADPFQGYELLDSVETLGRARAVALFREVIRGSQGTRFESDMVRDRFIEGLAAGSHFDDFDGALLNELRELQIDSALLHFVLGWLASGNEATSVHTLQDALRKLAMGMSGSPLQQAFFARIEGRLRMLVDGPAQRDRAERNCAQLVAGVLKYLLNTNRAIYERWIGQLAELLSQADSRSTPWSPKAGFGPSLARAFAQLGEYTTARWVVDRIDGTLEKQRAIAAVLDEYALDHAQRAAPPNRELAQLAEFAGPHASEW